MREEFVRGAQPPDDGARVIAPRLLCVRPGQPATVVMLCERCWGVTTHYRPAGPWGTARSVACLAPDRPCPQCHLPMQWSGFFGVWDCQADRPALLVLTADAARQTRWRRGTGDPKTMPPLRGSKWRVMRTSARPNSPLTCELVGLRTTGFELVREPNPVPVILKLYPELAGVIDQAEREDGDAP